MDQGVFLGESNRIDSILLITNDMVDALKKHDIKVFLLHFFEKVQQKQPLYQKVYSTNNLPEKQQTPPYSDILRIVTNERLTMLFFYSYRLFTPFNDFLIRRFRHSYGSLYKLCGALLCLYQIRLLFESCNDIFAINHFSETVGWPLPNRKQLKG